MPLRVVYKCADGTDFPVDWEDPADAELTWSAEREHARLPVLPIETGRPHMGEGIAKAFAEVGLEAPPVALERGMLANGFPYTPMAPPGMRFLGPLLAVGELAKKSGGPMAFWEEYCLPKVRQHCERLGAMDEHASVREIFDASLDSISPTFLSIFSVFPYLNPLIQFCNQEFGREGEMIVGQLTAGYRHATVDADEELWQLAQLAKRSPDVAAVLRDEAAPWPQRLRKLEEQGEFWQAFSDFLAKYGDRGEHWQVASPTWQEQPETPLAIIGGYLRSNASSPLGAVEAAAGRREALLKELDGRLTPEKAAQLRALLANASFYAPLREDRAYWQLLASGRARLALLRIGARLVREGRIGRDDDVLFLTADEIEGGSGDMRAEARERRAEWERWASVEPPRTIGAPPQAAGGPSPFAAFMDTGGAAPSDDPKLLTGIAASKGQVTATARVIRSPQDGARLGRGEVMVCVMTAPPWTPLFAIAGAVVTETGGVLAHAAIVAREYGIPAVVATRGATTRIKDGQTVTVDGTAGTVRLGD